MFIRESKTFQLVFSLTIAKELINSLFTLRFESKDSKLKDGEIDYFVE